MEQNIYLGVNKIAWRAAIADIIKRLSDEPDNLQKIHTPYSLCDEMICKLKGYVKFEDKTFCVFNIEFIEVLISDYGVDGGNITFVTDCLKKAKLCKCEKYKDVHVVCMPFSEFLSRKGENMKFDVILCNPPYQAPTKNKGSGHTLWDKFVVKSFELCKEDGYVCLIHPPGWRRPNKSFREVGQILMDKQIEYLEMHDISDGEKTFGVCTRYDWHITKNAPNTHATTIVDDDKKTSRVNLKDKSCIPNGKVKEIISLLATSERDRIHLINDRSAYGADKPHVSDIQSGKFKHPCIYSLPQKGMQLKWSDTNKNGHFGIPKVIFTNGAAPQVIIDEKGEYGLTQWAFGIVDSQKNLPMIKKALESDKFVDLCRYTRFTLDKYDVTFISMFRKDFWKEFV